MTLSGFQELIKQIYFEKDRKRGLAETFMWFIEEVGELSRALLKNDTPRMREEFADVAAWLVSTASIAGIDIEEAVRKYENGCPKCVRTPCRCRER
ncbi:MAG: MazG nucleotide pyrophosphohydrolase domain-containing protein [bacterium]